MFTLLQAKLDANIIFPCPERDLHKHLVSSRLIKFIKILAAFLASNEKGGYILEGAAVFTIRCFVAHGALG